MSVQLLSTFVSEALISDMLHRVLIRDSVETAAPHAHVMIWLVLFLCFHSLFYFDCLQNSLTMRQTAGTMLVACDLVHLDPSWINYLLRELVDHRLMDPREKDWWDDQLIDHCLRHGTRLNLLSTQHDLFSRTGKLTETYCQFLWRDVPGIADPVVFHRMVDTMSTYGAMFRCDPSGCGPPNLVVPARLPPTVDRSDLVTVNNEIATGIMMQIVIRILTKYIPPGIIAQFIGNFCGSERIIFRACWSSGAAFWKDGSEHLVRLREATDHAKVEIVVAGSDKETVYNNAFKVKDACFKLLQDRYGGLLFDSPGDPESMGSESRQRLLDGVQNLDRKMERMEQVRYPSFRCHVCALVFVPCLR